MCVLQPPSPEVLEDEEKKPSGPRQWIGLGSEREIEEESVRETRKKVEWLPEGTFHSRMLEACFLIFTISPSSNHCAFLL